MHWWSKRGQTQEIFFKTRFAQLGGSFFLKLGLAKIIILMQIIN
jgi:hypothetical protein